MRGLALLALGALSCAAIAMQTDDFPERLGKGCGNDEQCELLVADARARVARCQPNAIGYIRCGDAQADLTSASALLDQRKREVATKEAAENEKRNRAERQAQEAKYEQREQEQRAAQKAEQERRAQLQAAAIAERTQHELLEQEANEKEEAAELERLRLLGRGGRDRELRACYKNAAGLCRELLQRLLSVAETDGEKKSLVALDQQLASRPEVQESTGGGGLRCCDGSASSCPCGGSHRGCCSHHGGVCGCN